MVLRTINVVSAGSSNVESLKPFLNAFYDLLKGSERKIKIFRLPA